jgi:hypothetical protein
MTAYFAHVASEVRRSLVSVQPTGMSGIVWNETQVVTAPVWGERLSTVTVKAGETASNVAAAPASPRVPVSALDVRGSSIGARAATRASSLPRPGDWIVAVWLTGETNAFAPANFRQHLTAACGVVTVSEVMTNLSLSRTMLGGGLFTMDGQLLALILPCGDRLAAIQPSGVDDMVRRATLIDERLLARFGILFSPLSDHERSYFRDAKGLLVREVWRGTAGDAAGLRPGDIVTALNATPVGALDDLRGLEARMGTPVALSGRRRGSAHSWSVMSGADSANAGATTTTAGVILEPPPSAYRIRSVAAGSRAERVGVRAGDRIVRIDGAEPRSQRAVDRSLTGTTAEAILLEIERDQRRVAVIIPAGESR